MGKIKGSKNKDPNNIWKFIKFQLKGKKHWLWLGHIDTDGYGTIRFNNKAYKAHNFVWLYLVGEIPKELQMDHKCRLRNCVNPDHLEPVTPKENINRGLTGKLNNYQSKKTHCRYGHPYSKENTYIKKGGWRECRKCIAIRSAKQRQCLLQ